jgi:hypothetical protein
LLQAPLARSKDGDGADAPGQAAAASPENVSRPAACAGWSVLDGTAWHEEHGTARKGWPPLAWAERCRTWAPMAGSAGLPLRAPGGAAPMSGSVDAEARLEPP